MQYRPQLLQDVKLIHKLFTMKNLSKLTFILFAFTLLFTACSKSDDDNSLTKDKKLVSIVFPPGSQGKQMVANYRYDDQGRLIEIVQENPYLVTFTFTYMLDGRVEKIKVLKDFFDQKYIDYTFFMKAKARYPTGLDTVAPCLHIPPML
jgi:hypothetical protein